MPMRCRAISSIYEHVMRTALVAFFVLLAMSAATKAQVQSVKLLTPRLFGYFVGDVLEDEVDIRVDKGTELVPASVPQRGSLNAWIELVGSSVETDEVDGARLYRLYLAYQNFYPAIDARQLEIPGFTLSFKSGEQIYSAQVRAWSFGISPLREVLPPARASGAEYMQPDVLPPFYNARRDAYIAFALLAAALATLTLLAYHLAWWPFGARRHRPFTEAARSIRKLLKGNEAEPAYREAFVILHRAVDATAGHAVFSEDVRSFLAQHPAFARLRDEFTRFFASSQQAFFGESPADAIAAFSPAELRRFSDQLAAAERSVS
jgi:mxaA protein